VDFALLFIYIFIRNGDCSIGKDSSRSEGLKYKNMLK
jgi:hypothetical protein